MSSEKRIAASRANGKKSRGPVTEEGKRASSRNAQTHGLCANTIIIQGESVERFNSMLAALIDVHRPTDEMEMQLVEAMAVNKWRQLRQWEMFHALHSVEIRDQPETAPRIAAEAPPVRAGKAMDSLAQHSTIPHLGARYDAAFDRGYYRAARELRESRREKREIVKRT